MEHHKKTEKEIDEFLLIILQMCNSITPACSSQDIDKKIKRIKSIMTVFEKQGFEDREAEVIECLEFALEHMQNQYHNVIGREAKRLVDRQVLANRSSKKQMAFQEILEAGLAL